MLEQADSFFAVLEKPQNFRFEDSEGAVVKVETTYNALCSSLEANGCDTKGMTVMQLYSRLNYFKELHEKMERKTKK